MKALSLTLTSAETSTDHSTGVGSLIVTSFRRKEHYRRSKNGLEYYVSATTVNRYDWSRESFRLPPLPAQPKSPSDLFFERYPEFRKTKSVAACFVNRNATCPVCGIKVFYYQNEYGSRVFFDDLGPPWPKHPCTDTRLVSVPNESVQLGLTFGIRSRAEVAEVMKWQNDCGLDLESAFNTKYGTKPWSLVTIVRRTKGEKKVFIIARLLKQGRAAKIYFSCKSLPKFCAKGLLIAIGKQKVSYIDSVTLAPVEIAIKRYRGAASFLDAMDSADVG